jgi:hypothetical protein
MLDCISSQKYYHFVRLMGTRRITRPWEPYAKKLKPCYFNGGRGAATIGVLAGVLTQSDESG